MAKTPKTTHAHALHDLTVEPLELGPFNPDAGKLKDHFALKHWQVARDDKDIAWAVLDKSKASANTLSKDVLTELDDLLIELEKKPPAALVLRSAKKNGFVAGAEISEFEQLVDPAIAKMHLGKGLDIFKRLENFPAPTIALIHGFCLGGGLELALACKFRIARNDAKLGFPEVMLGLHPGLAGTWRSLELMNPLSAMTLMLTGRSWNARKAKRAGLIDFACEERHFADAVNAAVNGKLRIKRPPQWQSKLLKTMPARALTAWRMTQEVSKRARAEHYPAPYALIDLWHHHGGDKTTLGVAETNSFIKLMSSDTAQNLIKVFFLQEKLKAFAKDSKTKLAHIHIIGAGAMGGDIAAWCALQGYKVTLEDRTQKYIAPAIARAAKLFKRKLKNEGKVRSALDRLIPDVQAYGLSQADLVIEAVPENLDIKAKVFAKAESKMRPDAILATNTSTITLEQMLPLVKNKERFIGIHFFNPVAKMPLVEIITHAKLGSDAREKALGFVGNIRKLPLPVKSAPGFLVNRALTPYLLEALVCLDEGLKAEAIDEAAERFGMPMGPVALADQVGLDICLHGSEVMRKELKGVLPEIPAWFKEKVERGDLGKKTGKGLYTYDKGKPKKAKLSVPPDQALADRLILPMINACVACLREGVIESQDLADAGMIFGAGFAPFRGGPMAYVKARGVDECVAALKQLQEAHGDRFAPDPGWKGLDPKGLVPKGLDPKKLK